MEPLPADDLYKERYIVEKKIGQGGFGKVFLVKEKDGETCFAAKCIKVREVFKNATDTILKKNISKNCGSVFTFLTLSFTLTDTQTVGVLLLGHSRRW